MEHIYQQNNFGENWFTYPNLYSEIVKKFPSGSRFVEIGCWKGKSSSYMAVEIANSKKNIEFICVDTWKGGIEQSDINTDNLYEIFIDNMRPVEKFYKHLRTTSIQASILFENESLDFVFIDASHSYIDVKNDILAWKPKIKKGGILAGHDYSSGWPEVVKAVDELIQNDMYFTELCWVHNIK